MIASLIFHSHTTGPAICARESFDVSHKRCVASKPHALADAEHRGPESSGPAQGARFRAGQH